MANTGTILLAILVPIGGLIFIGLLAYLAYKHYYAPDDNKGTERENSFREHQPNQADNIKPEPVSQRKLSKISRENWDIELNDKKAVMIEQNPKGEVKILNPSVLSKSDYQKNPEELQDKAKKGQAVVTFFQKEPGNESVSGFPSYNGLSEGKEALAKKFDFHMGSEGSFVDAREGVMPIPEVPNPQVAVSQANLGVAKKNSKLTGSLGQMHTVVGKGQQLDRNEEEPLTPPAVHASAWKKKFSQEVEKGEKR